MAGSLSHVITDEGNFRMGYLDHMGDAHEALLECVQIIVLMTKRFTKEEFTSICKEARASFPLGWDNSEWPPKFPQDISD